MWHVPAIFQLLLFRIWESAQTEPARVAKRSISHEICSAFPSNVPYVTLVVLSLDARWMGTLAKWSTDASVLNDHPSKEWTFSRKMTELNGKVIKTRGNSTHQSAERACGTKRNHLTQQLMLFLLISVKNVKHSLCSIICGLRVRVLSPIQSLSETTAVATIYSCELRILKKLIVYI